MRAVLPGLEVALAQRLARRVGGRVGRRGRVLLAGDRRPADAEVDEAAGVVQAVEDLEGEVGHLLEADRTRGPVLAPELEQQPSLGRGGDQLTGLEPGGEQLGGPLDDGQRGAGVVVGCRRRVAGGRPDGVDDRDDASSGDPGQPGHGGGDVVALDDGAGGAGSVEGCSRGCLNRHGGLSVAGTSAEAALTAGLGGKVRVCVSRVQADHRAESWAEDQTEGPDIEP